MAARLLLVLLTELLLSKITSSYMKSYPSSPYMRDPRSTSYQAYYPNYAPQVAQTYQRPANLPSAQRPVEYRQPTYQNTGGITSPGVQPTYQTSSRTPSPGFHPIYQNIAPSIQAPVARSPAYPTQVTPTYQPPIEYRSYQTPSLPPVTEKPVEYHPTYQTQKATVLPAEYMAAYQKMAEKKLPVEYLNYQNAVELGPTVQYHTIHQKIPEIESPIIQSLDYEPIVQKIVEYVTNQYQRPEYQAIETNSINSKLQIPAITSLALESLKDLPNSEYSLKPSPTLDATVLNNLAIALQLLIVNNIIYHPRTNSIESINFSDSLLESAYSSDLSSPCQMSNANFLVTSNFGDDSIMSKGMLGLGSCGSGISPRVNFNLMSPYEAIASSPSSFSESSPSLFTLKNNFQSPYAAIMAADNNKDLFSMSDLF